MMDYISHEIWWERSKKHRSRSGGSEILGAKFKFVGKLVVKTWEIGGSDSFFLPRIAKWEIGGNDWERGSDYLGKVIAITWEQMWEISHVGNGWER